MNLQVFAAETSRLERRVVDVKEYEMSVRKRMPRVAGAPLIDA